MDLLFNILISFIILLIIPILIVIYHSGLKLKRDIKKGNNIRCINKYDEIIEIKEEYRRFYNFYKDEIKRIFSDE